MIVRTSKRQDTVSPKGRQDILSCAVIVSYHPSTSILDNLAPLREQVDSIIVVDNTPISHPSSVVDDLEHLEGCVVIRNNKNLGIAAALNIGIRHAIAQGSAWILTLDQDSRVSEGYVQAMLSTYAEAS
jgi:rhamnosyltransferase